MNETRFLADDDDTPTQEEFIAPPPAEVPQPVELPEGVKEPQVFDEPNGLNMTGINENAPRNENRETD